MAEDFPRIVTRKELHFDIWFALGQIPPSLWREWLVGKELRREPARSRIVDEILARFDRYQVRAPAPMGNHGCRPMECDE